MLAQTQLNPTNREFYHSDETCHFDTSRDMFKYFGLKTLNLNLKTSLIIKKIENSLFKYTFVALKWSKNMVNLTQELAVGHTATCKL